MLASRAVGHGGHPLPPSFSHPLLLQLTGKGGVAKNRGLRGSSGVREGMERERERKGRESLSISWCGLPLNPLPPSTIFLHDLRGWDGAGGSWRGESSVYPPCTNGTLTDTLETWRFAETEKKKVQWGKAPRGEGMAARLSFFYTN